MTSGIYWRETITPQRHEASEQWNDRPSCRLMIEIIKSCQKSNLHYSLYCEIMSVRYTHSERRE